ncbi:hypothetical protein P691DRAFT_770906 [Macrolepiota fuliginosa MF-IS2]|uniref:Uncharacterized protein n=1 Tax=Macrolepiota fuliginosa MF-IS2 TaxID=1400762 RepID=A0A9P6C6Z2_9AGAR|nr:hypothetical protein P691DRAFT_770906 [Macrolepiota fuliginosa MF-IS2]
MLSVARQAVAPRLARKAAQTVLYSSSRAASNSAPGATNPSPTSPKRHDPGLEQRRAARLARETLHARQAAAAKGTTKPRNVQNDVMMSAASVALSGSPNKKKQNSSRPRKPSRRDQSSNPRGGTERSRMEASKPGAAEAIMAFSQREAPNRAAKSANNRNNGTVGDSGVDAPQFTTPEPIASDLTAALNTVPNLTSSLPPIPASQKLRRVPADWAKRVFGGDYSAYQVDTQHYLKGAGGPRSAYAKIILGRNASIPLGSQKGLVDVIRKVAREDRPIKA